MQIFHVFAIFFQIFFSKYVFWRVRVFYLKYRSLHELWMAEHHVRMISRGSARDPKCGLWALPPRFGPKSQICTSPPVLVKNCTALKFYQRVVRAQLNLLPFTAYRNSTWNRSSELSRIGEFGSMLLPSSSSSNANLATAISPTSVRRNRAKFGTPLPHIIP